MMVVVSREDHDAPRALSLGAPITTSCRGSVYEVELPPVTFLREKSYANVQGLQAIQQHELDGPLGKIDAKTLPQIRGALKYALAL